MLPKGLMQTATRSLLGSVAIVIATLVCGVPHIKCDFDDALVRFGFAQNGLHRDDSRDCYWGETRKYMTSHIVLLFCSRDSELIDVLDEYMVRSRRSVPYLFAEVRRTPESLPRPVVCVALGFPVRCVTGYCVDNVTRWTSKPLAPTPTRFSCSNLYLLQTSADPTRWASLLVVPTRVWAWRLAANILFWWSVLVVGISVARLTVGRVREAHGRCRQCAYVLDGLERCPECGTPAARAGGIEVHASCHRSRVSRVR
jgi:hypothetical protein